MKTNKLYVSITILGLLFSLNVFSQNVDLGKMSKVDREKYLTDLAIEVTKTYGPGYYRKDSKAVISKVIKFTTDDERPEVSKNIGREYYEVYFPYDPTKERLEWDFTSKVYIWKDNGQPFDIFFGNGIGRTFMFTPYTKATRAANVEQVPYQQANEILNIFDTTKKK